MSCSPPPSGWPTASSTTGWCWWWTSLGAAAVSGSSASAASPARSRSPPSASPPAGFSAWGLVEYVLHRFVMHGRPSIVRRSHALHHADDRAFISTPVFIVMALAAIICALLSRSSCRLAPPACSCSALYAGYNYYALLHHVQHHQGRCCLAGRATFARLERVHRIHHDHHRGELRRQHHDLGSPARAHFKPEDESRPVVSAETTRARSTSTLASLRRLHP